MEEVKRPKQESAVRLPDDLYTTLTDSAWLNRRSIRAEIIARLEDSISRVPPGGLVGAS